MKMGAQILQSWSIPHVDEQKNNSRILIVGTGALATLFAARLSQALYNVTMLGSWIPAVQALNLHGAKVLYPDDHVISAPVHAVDQPEFAGKFDYILVLVKSWQTENAAKQIKVSLNHSGIALTLQNGIGNDRMLAQEIGEQRVAVGVTTTGSALLEPGIVRFGGSGSVDVQKLKRLSPLVKMLKDAGFDVNEHEDVTSLQWGKLIINAAINPLTALYGVSNGVLLVDPDLRDFLRAATTEAVKVASAMGIQLPYEDPIEAVENVALRTALNTSSMLQDLRRGAPTEIEAITGVLVTEANRLKIPVPYNQALLEGIRTRVSSAVQTPAVLDIGLDRPI